MLEIRLVEWLADLCPHLYPGAAPLDYDCPAVIYNRITTDAEDDLDGWTGTGWASFQIDVYDPDFITAKTLAADIRDRMIEWDDDYVGAVSWTGEHDLIDQTTDTALYRTMMTFRLFATL